MLDRTLAVDYRWLCTYSVSPRLLFARLKKSRINFSSSSLYAESTSISASPFER